MIRYVTGDLLAADSEALVNSVNCVGGMGRGVALAFKRSFPDNFKAYKSACDWGELQTGRMFVFETGELMPRLIINFPTKQHWRARSRLADIEAGLFIAGGRSRAAPGPLNRPAATRVWTWRSRLDRCEALHSSCARRGRGSGRAGLRAARRRLGGGIPAGEGAANDDARPGGAAWPHASLPGRSRRPFRDPA